MLRTAGCAAGTLAVLVLSVPVAHAEDNRRFGIEIEARPVWQSRNNVRIPKDTGTELSLRGIQGSGPFAAGRVSFD